MQAFRRLNLQQFFDTRVKPLLTDSILFRCKHRYTSLNPEQFPYFVSSRSMPCQSCFTQNFVEHLKQYFQRTPTVSFSGLLRAVGTAKRQERSGASWYRQETNRKYRHYYNSLLGNWSSESYKQARQGSSDSDATGSIEQVLQSMDQFALSNAAGTFAIQQEPYRDVSTETGCPACCCPSSIGCASASPWFPFESWIWVCCGYSSDEYCSYSC